MKALLPVFNKIFLISALAFLLASNNLLGQEFQYYTEQPRNPFVYLGLGLVVNESGLLFSLELPFTQNLSMNGNFGVGSWGWKSGGSLNYYPLDVSGGHELSFGFSTASGLKNFTTELEVEPGGMNQNVNLDLNRVNTINLVYTYNLEAGRSVKVAFSGGWAICLTQDPYSVNSTVLLSSTSKEILRIMQPGGLILGVKIMIGL